MPNSDVMTVNRIKSHLQKIRQNKPKSYKDFQKVRFAFHLVCEDLFFLLCSSFSLSHIPNGLRERSFMNAFSWVRSVRCLVPMTLFWPTRGVLRKGIMLGRTWKAQLHPQPPSMSENLPMNVSMLCACLTPISPS